MPKHYRRSESVIKRARTIEKATLRNQMFKTNLKTTIKKYEAALAGANSANNANNDGSADKINLQDAYKAAVRKIDKAAARGIIHKNKAARKKSQFAKKYAAAQ